MNGLLDVGDHISIVVEPRFQTDSEQCKEEDENSSTNNEGHLFSLFAIPLKESNSPTIDIRSTMSVSLLHEVAENDSGLFSHLPNEGNLAAE
jgi:hypothetical protein